MVTDIELLREEMGERLPSVKAMTRHVCSTGDFLCLGCDGYADSRSQLRNHLRRVPSCKHGQLNLDIDKRLFMISLKIQNNPKFCFLQSDKFSALPLSPCEKNDFGNLMQWEFCMSSEHLAQYHDLLWKQIHLIRHYCPKSVRNFVPDPELIPDFIQRLKRFGLEAN